jgi:ribose/xylose/arabinose/galactoside ABC-type transport system permease subunit/ABC-type multidrug transport system ATPase subunit
VSGSASGPPKPLDGARRAVGRLNGSRASVPGEASGRIGLGLLAALLVLFFSLRFDGFFTADNAIVIAVNMSAIAIAVMGTAALLISGNVDLSIGSMYALVGVIVGQVAVATQSATAAVVAGLVAGLFFGALNGALVRALRISPLIVTIGMLAVYRGLAFFFSGGESLYGFPQSFAAIGRGGIGQIPYPVIVAAAVFIVTGFVLTRTARGLHVYAIGGDARAAELNGVPVGRTTVGLYALNGLLIGLVGVLTTARLGSATPQLGVGFELDVITAAILGGVAFTGGAGRPIGLLFGVATIGILNAGLVFEGLADYYQQIAKGSILLLALAADQLGQVWRARRIGRQATGATGRPTDGRAEDGASLRRGMFKRPEPVTGPPVLRAEGLSKRYGAVHALRDGRLAVRPGEVVALLGDNGAGKSTLIKILSGAVRPTTGKIELSGAPAHINSPADARRAGIETVYQDLALCPNLSVAHNFILGAEPRRRLLGLIPVRDDAAAESLADWRLRDLGIELRNTGVLVASLSGGQRQSVAIARAIKDDVKVVILDEPTAALGVAQTKNVLKSMRSVADLGTGVVMIAHDIESILAVADRVVVLRLGRVVHEGPTDELSELELLQLMAGLRGGNTEEATADRQQETQAHAE